MGDTWAYSPYSNEWNVYADAESFSDSDEAYSYAHVEGYIQAVFIWQDDGSDTHPTFMNYELDVLAYAGGSGGGYTTKLGISPAAEQGEYDGTAEVFYGKCPIESGQPGYTTGNCYFATSDSLNFYAECTTTGSTYPGSNNSTTALAALQGNADIDSYDSAPN